MDACRLGDAISTAPLISLFLKILYNSIDFPFTCPMGPGKFSIKNFKISSMLPILPNTKVCAKITQLVKSKTSKNFITALILKVNATYVL